MAAMVEIEVTYCDETNEAYKVSFEGANFFLPKSVTKFDEEDPDFGDVVTASIPEWLALKEGMI